MATHARVKRAALGDRVVKVGSTRNKKRGITCDWSKVPYHIMVHVFQYLRDGDRFRAAQTCKAWLQPFSHPALFRTGQFQYGSMHRAITFARVKGKLLRHIYFKASRPNFDFPPTIRGMYQFLSNLINSGNNQLITLNLASMRRLSFRGIYTLPMLVELLAILLANQTHLRELDLSHASLIVKQGSQILEAVAKNCSQTLQRLDITSFIDYGEPEDDEEETIWTNFVSALCSFKNLSDLELSYEVLLDDVLRALAGSSKSLQNLKVYNNNYDTAVRGTTPEAWQRLTSACPGLKVEMFVRPRFEYHVDPALCAILTPSTPLHNLHWHSGAMISLDNMKLCFQHIAIHFQSTLHHICFKSGVRLARGDVGELFESLHECSHLETVSINLKCDFSIDEEFYRSCIKEAVDKHHITCSKITLNGRTVSS
ncbi:F-box only protein 39-like [Physella acuta]|uniref:F-box only protein 39-like n=1 Tax=Physella acuta TaxID=109671 RepID=UPI0027DE3FE4|nr:F-box only protein 39-like [Physella acuta]